MEERFELARSLARECGDMALAARRASAFAVRQKGPQDLVTDIDLRVEATIRARIAAAFPGDTVLGEEGGLSGEAAGVVWIVDPIDGTANFVRDMGCWCVSIAAMAAARLVLGVVYDPTRGELFAARADGGASCNEAPLRAAGTDSLGEAIVAVGYCPGFPPARLATSMAGVLSAGATCRDLGSAALSLAYVAAGRLDGYAEAGIKSWDVAAGALIVAEAGGHVTPLAAGDALLRPMAIIAAARGIAAPLTDLMRQAWLAPDQLGSPVPAWLSATAL